MKIVKIEPIQTYSCVFCHKEFIRQVKESIISKYSPVCSERCKFKLLFRIFQKMNLSKENLLVLCENNDVKLISGLKKDFEPNFLIFELIKKVKNKLNLLTIKQDLSVLVQVLVQKKLVQESELDFLVQKTGSSISLYNKEMNQFEPEPVLTSELEPTKRRFIEKWIK